MNMDKNQRLTFVIPWYGTDIGGGAETLCREFCERLSKKGNDVRVLTTCCRSFQTNWNQNSYKEGAENINGVNVHRFKVRPGNHKIFNDLNAKILKNYPLSQSEEMAFFKESINSDNLLKFIKSDCADDILIFIPYLYGLTFNALKIYPDRSFLLPCLHKEGYAFLASMNEIFSQPKGLIFNSPEEKLFAQKLYSFDSNCAAVIGMGIEKKIIGDKTRFSKRFKIDMPYILYVGRKDETKNVPLLIRLFSGYIAETKTNIKLILAGHGDVEIPREMKGFITDAGFLDEETKADAYAGALATCQPSLNESFSITIMESWLQETPALVHSFCDVTRGHCERSNGGLFFKDYYEFKECMDFFLHHPEIRNKMGINGGRYVEKNYTWDMILMRFLNFITAQTRNM